MSAAVWGGMTEIVNAKAAIAEPVGGLQKGDDAAKSAHNGELVSLTLKKTVLAPVTEARVISTRESFC